MDNKHPSSRRRLLAGLVGGGALAAPALLAATAARANTPPPFDVRAAPRFYPRPDFAPGVGLAGKVAVVTGASRGIGLAVALALKALGVAVIETSRTPLAYPGHPVPLLALDLADPASIGAFVGAVLSRPEVQSTGGIDILVNNAGRFALGSVIPSDPAAYFGGLQLAQATLYGGPVALTSALLPALAARGAAGYARILFTVSVVGYGVGGSEPGSSYYHAYTAGKRALLAYANCLRGLLTAAGTGIRVSTLNPHSISTDLATGTRPIFLQPVDAGGNAIGDPNFQALLTQIRLWTANGIPAAFAAQAFVQLLGAADPEPNVAVGSAVAPYSVQGSNELISAVGAAEMQQSAYPWVAGPLG